MPGQVAASGFSRIRIGIGPSSRFFPNARWRRQVEPEEHNTGQNKGRESNLGSLHDATSTAGHREGCAVDNDRITVRFGIADKNLPPSVGIRSEKGAGYIVVVQLEALVGESRIG